MNSQPIRYVKQIPADVRSGWQDPREDLRKSNPDQLERFRRDYQFHQRLVAMMQRYGVGLLAGTDTGDAYVLPGYALHDELASLVEAGLTPAQALRTATINPARFFNIEAQAGSIAKGQRADLVLLDANPLDDIRNTRKIAAVILRGAASRSQGTQPTIEGDRRKLERQLPIFESCVRTALSKTTGFIDASGLHALADAGSKLHVRVRILLCSDAACFRGIETSRLGAMGAVHHL